MLRVNTSATPVPHLSIAPVCVFQNLTQRSAVPPPVASRLLWGARGTRRQGISAARGQGKGYCVGSIQNGTVKLFDWSRHAPHWKFT